MSKSTNQAFSAYQFKLTNSLMAHKASFNGDMDAYAKWLYEAVTDSVSRPLIDWDTKQPAILPNGHLCMDHDFVLSAMYSFELKLINRWMTGTKPSITLTVKSA